MKTATTKPAPWKDATNPHRLAPSILNGAFDIIHVEDGIWNTIGIMRRIGNHWEAAHKTDEDYSLYASDLEAFNAVIKAEAANA